MSTSSTYPILCFAAALLRHTGLYSIVLEAQLDISYMSLTPYSTSSSLLIIVQTGRTRFNNIRAHVCTSNNPYCDHQDSTRHLLSVPDPLQLLDNQEVCVQEAVDAVLGARLFALVEALGLDGAGDAFRPADVCEVVDG